MLWDGPLTLAHLAAQPDQRRELAYLSACQTAAGSPSHPDEALHIAAAFHYLGYRHVLATMWHIGDAAASRVADRVYASLAEAAETNSGEPDARLAAEALHQAVGSLRRAAPAYPLHWAPYIHIGP